MIQRRGVAEGHGNLAGAAADLIRGMLGEFGVDLGPRGGLLQAILSDETILDAVEEGGAELVVRGEQRLAQDFELFAFRTGFDRRGGETTCGEVGEFAEGCLPGEGESADRIGGDRRFQRIPEQERDVLVSDVLGALRQGFDPAPAVGDREALGGGGDATTHDGGGVVLAELGDALVEAGGRPAAFGGAGDGPAADGGALGFKRAEQGGFGEGALGVQRPEGAQLTGVVGVLEEDLLERGGRGRVGAAFLEEAAGVAYIPIVGVEVMGDQFRIGKLGEVDLHGLHGVGDDLIHAAVGAIGEFLLLVARDFVVPVIDEDAAIRTILRGEATEPAVGAHAEVHLLFAAVTAAGRDHRLAAELVHVDVVEEELVAPFGGEGAAEVHHRAGVGGLLIATPGDGLDVFVRMDVRVSAGLALIAGALDGVPHVRDDAGLEESFAVVVPIHAPLVAAAFAPAFEDLPRRVETPDRGFDKDALVVRGAGFAHEGAVEDAVRAVEPAIRAPDEVVQGLVGVVALPTVEHDLRFAGRLGLVAFLDRDEEQVGRRAEPDAAEAHGDTARERGLVPEDRLLIEGAGALGVLEDDDAVLGYARAGGVVGAFDDPEAAAIIDRVGDGLDDLGLADNQLDTEACGYLQGRGGPGRGERRLARGGPVLVVQRFIGRVEQGSAEREREEMTHEDNSSPVHRLRHP